MVDLATEYLGLKLSNPLVPSSSPLTGDAATARRLEDAGAAAIVMPSLFEEEVHQSEESVARFLHEQAIGFGEADSFLPVPEECSTPLDEYLELLATLKASLDIPVIADRAAAKQIATDHRPSSPRQAAAGRRRLAARPDRA